VKSEASFVLRCNDLLRSQFDHVTRILLERQLEVSVDEIDVNRRNFIKQGVAALGTVALGKSVLTPLSAWAETSAPPKKVLKLVDEIKNPTAKDLKFVHDATKSKERTNLKALCLNCIQYKKMGEVDGAEVGRCNMITLGYVKSTGWCKSWGPHPKVYKK